MATRTVCDFPHDTDGTIDGEHAATLVVRSQKKVGNTVSTVKGYDTCWVHLSTAIDKLKDSTRSPQFYAITINKL